MLIILVGSVRPVTAMGVRIASPVFQKISSAKKEKSASRCSATVTGVHLFYQHMTMAPRVLYFGSFDSVKINRRNAVIEKNNFLSLIQSTEKSGKMKTFVGKTTERDTGIFPRSYGSLYKITRRINKDFSISDIIEHRHK